MKNYGHIIAKVILIALFSLLFSMSGVMLKEIPGAVNQHEKSLGMPTATFSDRIDKWVQLKSDELYYAVKPMSVNNIVIYSTMFSIILVLFMDITVGIGRSRSEERRSLKNQM